MSGDTQPLKVKKSKKSDSKAIDAIDAVEQPTADDSVKNIEKKKKKKSKKSKDEAGSEEVAMVVDTEEPQTEEPEKDKKKKKKSQKTDADVRESGATEAMDVDAEPKDIEKKKKKKKKAEEAAEDSAVVSEDSDKKKKRKRDEQDAAAASTSESKKEKKQRKKQKKEESSATSTPAESSSTPSNVASTSSAASPGDAAAFLAKHSVTITCPPGVPDVTPIISFTQLNVPAELQTSFKGFKEPTPIQACTWPPALEGRDVVGIAETGSGKTLAFGIPALNRLIQSTSKNSTTSGKSTVSILVVAPTRELAIQTHDTLCALGKPFGIASVAVFGGVPKDPQVKMLKNANKAKDGLTTRIIVGTPGRILDLMQDGACDLSQVNYLVLDEADRMLDKGFENDIRNIIAATKPAAERQTMMFSATWPEAVRRLASTFQRDPVRVTVGSDDLTANSRVEQSVEVFDDGRSKDQRLLNLLKTLAHKKTTTTGASEARILVFALYKKEASRVEQMLARQGYSVGALHGDMSQNARMETLENFKNGTTGLMVATDVAARGLDIPNVGAVINYTFPLTIEDYIHRIGRTGRGGKTGKSITFFTGEGHERALAGEFARVLREGGFDNSQLQTKFPMTIKKKEHSAYGAFFRDDIPVPKGPTKIAGSTFNRVVKPRGSLEADDKAPSDTEPDDTSILDENEGSIITSLISQLRRAYRNFFISQSTSDPFRLRATLSLCRFLLCYFRVGMDLSKVTFPTFVLEPRSMLERITDFIAESFDDPEERFIRVLQYYLAGWHIKPKGVKKPYNPVLGEFFRCRYDYPNGTQGFYIAEQVSHHPPVSAFFYISPANHVSIIGELRPKSKFLGNSVSTTMEGENRVTLLGKPEDGEYVITMPNMYARGILFGKMVLELGDTCIAKNEKHGLSCDLEFKTKGFFSGTYNALAGRVRKNSTDVGEVSGRWSHVMEIKNHKTGQKRVLFDALKDGQNISPKWVPPEDEQEPNESRRLWSHLTDAIVNKDMEAATVAKTSVEDAQREERKHREESGSEYIPRFFEKENGRWQPKLKIPKDPQEATRAVQEWIFPTTTKPGSATGTSPPKPVP
ncbi:hypothetical protein CVT25_014990 [Psilocybe cyanescens]|uniref:RNA helicase n=1 Tax=Psilocybe cyanescens TaxID=93625 RepID=A0A409XI87_PSICY|nr:hypothetical protein CVT25_014990 [Psilocybe cyanescens]